ncbi:hypothetical protein ABZ805_01290 [Saccharopolyspora sp. NPDC047091]|uniref:hypothetical protein n=1 Tax=Saccharopolyspora sp. NPDC047091 TaxID=3155924 RepID=UPI0033D06DE8
MDEQHGLPAAAATRGGTGGRPLAGGVTGGARLVAHRDGPAEFAPGACAGDDRQVSFVERGAR